MPVDTANIPATINATVIKSASTVVTIATIIPKIPPFLTLTEDTFAGVDVDAVKLNGGEQDNNNEDKNNFYDPIAEDESNNFPFSFDRDSPTMKESSTKKAKTAKINCTVSKPKGRNISREEDIALCKAFINLSVNSIEGKE